MESFLILDPDGAIRERLSHYFGAQGFYLDTVEDEPQALQHLEKHVYDVVIFDVAAIDSSPHDFLGLIKDNNSHAVMIAVSERSKFDDAIHAIREGASDFILKPISLAELEIKVDKGIELKNLHKEGQALRGERPLIYKTKNFIGRSPSIRKVLALVERVAMSSTSVVLLGETGTGKELLAGAIHYNSARARNAFVRVNCATLPDTLLESELFGHERGAFTGAEKLRIGRFEQANGGTVFLDEIADVTLATQAKLLRVLQEHEFERLGSNRTIKIDVRVIAATNKNLEEEIAEGRFRSDLYYRLNVVTINIPPLRDRDGDIEPLAQYFLHRYSQMLRKHIKKIDRDAMALLEGYRWPGNIRELENTMERAVLMADSDVITPEDLSLPFKPELRARDAVVQIPEGGIDWQQIEKDLVVEALTKTKWVQKDAAALLGLTTRVLNYKIKHFGITHPSWIHNR